MNRHLLPESRDAELEAQLRAAVPALPPALRSRTLMRCAIERDALRRKRRRGQLRWAWTLTGLCAFHWFAISYLDAQSAALINGKTPPTLVATAPMSLDELRVALAARSQILAFVSSEKRMRSEAVREAG
jgi:hypothetical protein